MLRIFRASILVLAFACSAFGGEIHNPSAAPQPTPQPQNTVEEITPGEIPNPQQVSEITEISLSILSSVLSLF